MSDRSSSSDPFDLTWLHISDLHFEPNMEFERRTVLDGLIECASKYRAQGRWVPDLLFVTGDIANRGADKEYERASEFFNSLLSALNLGKNRVFVVPGNHDVDRSRGLYLTRTLASENASDIFFSSDPSRALPHLSKLRAFRDWHQSYFAGVHDFDPFNVSSAPTAVEIRDHSVGILPISSATFCLDDNDHGKLWIGRAWLNAAVERLAQMRTSLRIALMHHPLDWLHDEERAQIKVELYKHIDVILRGHLHDTEAEATASTIGSLLHLAAGASYQSPQWPKRALLVGADLNQRTLHVHPLEYRKDPHRQWTLDTSVFPNRAPKYEEIFKLDQRHDRLADAPNNIDAAHVSERRLPSRAKSLTRSWTIFPNGISDVTVTLEQVEIRDELVLAIPTIPFCATTGDRYAKCSDGVLIPVIQDEPISGRTRFRLIGQGSHAECTWRYQISNAMALDQNDAFHLSQQRQSGSPIPDGMDGRPHVVRFVCDKLVLRYEFEGREPAIDTAVAIVERWLDEPGREQWIRSPEQEHRCRILKNGDTKMVTLEADQPLLNHRYTLAFRPAQPGHKLPLDAVRGAHEILFKCRGVRSRADDLVNELSTTLETQMESVLEEPLGRETSWLGFLWNGEKRALLPAYGRFPNQAWSVRFPFGSGVAGHSFRFARTATWYRNDRSLESLVFQPRTDAGGGYSQTYLWVVSVPILLALNGPAIGIVSFASSEIETDGDRWMYEFAQDAAVTPESESVLRKRSALLAAVNTGFWGAVKSSINLSSQLREQGDRVLRALNEGGT